MAVVEGFLSLKKRYRYIEFLRETRYNENLPETYQKMMDWAARHHYQCMGNCYERCVTDYWTTRNSQEFVTELLIPVQRKNKV